MRARDDSTRRDSRRNRRLNVADARPVVKARARELLARIALTSHDPGSARVQAQRVLEFDPTSPVPAFVEGRLLYERGHYADALSLLEQAVEETSALESSAVARPSLLPRRDSAPPRSAAEAEAAFTTELSAFPENGRAHLALATLYHTTGRTDEADAATTAMLEAMNTPEAYDTAIRLWTTFGDRARAAALKADAQRVFPRSGQAH